jgi:type VI secretion system secreted protein VgrG
MPYTPDELQQRLIIENLASTKESTAPRKLWSRTANTAFMTIDLPEVSILHLIVEESVSRPFRIHLTLVSRRKIELDTVIRKNALIMVDAPEEESYFHGVIGEIADTGVEGDFHIYKAVLHPLAWLMSMRHNCRIFQDKTVKDIVSHILKENTITEDFFEFRLQDTLKPREYCVQYRETDLEFISRLLAEEGIFYFFEHNERRHLMVFGDSPACYKPKAGREEVPYKTGAAWDFENEVIFSLSASQRIRPGRVILRDYNFQKPSLDLTVNEEAELFKKLEIYDFPGDYQEKDPGKRYAQLRLQENTMYSEAVVGEGMCPLFRPLKTFKLADHHADSFNKKYVVTECVHEGFQPQVLEEWAHGAAGFYNLRFRGVPDKVKVRPRQVTPKPVMDGVQTAIVTGPQGEEIYTDKHGRIKVQFHWDREGQHDERSSCWIRVAQNWAGSSWGSIYVPRIDMEVLVDFIEGDPDRPIVTGCVYNGRMPPPFPLPDRAMVSGVYSNSTPGQRGYNEITLDDTAGKEDIVIHGQYDMNTTVEHDQNLTIHNNRTTTVDVNEIRKVGVDQSLQVGSNQNITIGASRHVKVGAMDTLMVGASRTENIGAGLSITATGPVAINSGASTAITTTGATNITSGAAVSITSPNIMVNAPSSLQLICGGSSIIIGPGFITITSPGIISLNGAMVKNN